MQEERIHIIADYLRSRSSATVPELASMLHVSLDTIRRDLRLLERRGIVSKVHGGAVLTSVYERENIYPIRRSSNVKEKNEIAVKASAHVQEGQFLAINAGTTGNQLAKRLLSTHHLLTILTNSISIADTLSDNPGFTVILSGGEMNTTEGSLGGRIAEYACSQYYTDIAFVSVNAISIASGLTDFRSAEVGIINTIMPRAKKRIVIASSDKFEKKSHIFVAPVSSAEILITDNRIKPETAELYRGNAIDLQF